MEQGSTKISQNAFNRSLTWYAYLRPDEALWLFKQRGVRLPKSYEYLKTRVVNNLNIGEMSPVRFYFEASGDFLKMLRKWFPNCRG